MTSIRGTRGARLADAAEWAQRARLGLALRLALRESTPEAQSLVAGAGDDRLPVGGTCEVEDLPGSREATYISGAQARQSKEERHTRNVWPASCATCCIEGYRQITT